jgi:WD40 repeat protein
MSDLFLTETPDGGDLQLLKTGQPRTSSGLTTAVYLSLFTALSWQDATRQPGGRYNSRIPEIRRSRLVNNQTRLAIISAAENALSWVVDEAGGRVEVDATIESSNLINITVNVTGPQGEEVGVYGVNWNATTGEFDFVEAPDVEIDISGLTFFTPWSADAHADAVAQIAFSADSSTVYSGANDGTIVATDIATGDQKWVFTEFTEKITGILAASTGEVYASSLDGSVRKINPDTGAEEWAYHPGGTGIDVFSIMLSPDEQFVFAYFNQTIIRKLDVADGSPTTTLDRATADIDVATERITGFLFASPDGSKIIAFGPDLFAIDVATCALAWSHTAGDIVLGASLHPAEPGQCIAFYLNFSVVTQTFANISIADGNVVGFSDALTDHSPKSLTGRAYVDTELRAHGDSIDAFEQTFSFSQLDLNAKSVLRDQSTSIVSAVDLDTARAIFAPDGLSNAVYSYNTEESSVEWVFNGFTDSISAAAISPDKSVVVAGSSAGRLKNIDFTTGAGIIDEKTPPIEWVHDFYNPGSNANIIAIEPSHDGESVFALQNQNQTFRLARLDATSGLERFFIARDDAGVTASMVADPAAPRLYLSSSEFLPTFATEKRIVGIDTETGTEIFSEIVTNSGEISLSPDGTKLYVLQGSSTLTLDVFSATNGAVISNFTLSKFHSAGAVSADGAKMYAVAVEYSPSQRTVLSEIDLSTGTETEVLEISSTTAESGARAVATANALYVFFSTNKIRKIALPGYTVEWTNEDDIGGFEAREFALSPDGAFIYANSDSMVKGGVREIDVATGLSTRDIDPLPTFGPVTSVAAPTNNSIYMGSRLHVAKLKVR